MLEAALLINDRDVDAAGAATFDLLDPVTGEVATRAAAASIEDAVVAANAAAAAFPIWSETGPGERRARLNDAADILLDRKEELKRAITSETGGTDAWGEFNCHLAASMLREAASMATLVAGEVIPADKADTLSLVLRQPAGVSLGIAPWNAPVALGVRAVAMPLACGNTVILKGSELCPKTHRLIGDIFCQAGLPPGTVNVVLNAPDDASAIVDALIAHPAVRRVNFTGSTRVGRQVAETCARHLKRCLLELGGKSPIVILDDADLDEAVKAASFGAFMHQGQICISTGRIIILESIADAFVEKFAAKAGALQAGDPSNPDTDLGPLINREAVKRVQALIADAVEKGAKLVVGGEVDDVFMQATVLDNVDPSMRIYHEETFGPAVPIIRVGSVDEAITYANDTEYGLSASVFGRDISRALQVARKLETGMCHINAATIYDEPQMPFGGVKASGYGRFGGKTAIDEFTELRWISVQTGPQHFPI
ncbi:MAG: aldehyde dehydrogenase [Alphaproteobacteria bacterium]|nr:aldehyde dehydrogenase [Alphaproteobacteria bacterium]